MKSRKRKEKLESRQRDFDEMKKSTRHELKVSNRIESSGYRKPGSQNK